MSEVMQVLVGVVFVMLASGLVACLVPMGRRKPEEYTPLSQLGIKPDRPFYYEAPNGDRVLVLLDGSEIRIAASNGGVAALSIDTVNINGREHG